MPKIIELTVELEVQKVSCPGVWLCQDGRVSLTVFGLGTSYQTCMLPPAFPLMFKDVFYFRKRFQETCALNNICCLLKDETIYCELVQWCEDCMSGECTILAQYLGALNDVLFPPNMCSNDGVDLLMRRSKDFPGILSPKIEIATKVRIDEVWNKQSSSQNLVKVKCQCVPDTEGPRQKPVCHSAQYHRNKCPATTHRQYCSRSRSRSEVSKSCCSLSSKEPTHRGTYCGCPPTKSRCTRRSPTRRSRRSRECYSVYNVQTPATDQMWRGIATSNVPSTNNSDIDECCQSSSSAEKEQLQYDEDKINKLLLESRYIDQDRFIDARLKDRPKPLFTKARITPCVCEICKRYHELFHTNVNS